MASSSLLTLHGTPDPVPAPVILRAGPVTAALDGVDLRYVRIGEVELVRRIYVAVRDRNWNTIPGIAAPVEVNQRDDGFTVGFSVRHTSSDTDFSWAGTITGDADGIIRFAMDGRAERAMLFNRVGFCVLHPWRESAGRPYRAMTPDGPSSGRLPRMVAPQRFENGAYVPLFPSVSQLDIDLETGGVTFTFDGDLFETEDQRNWTDASLKTYCTPLSLGFPHELAEGERRSQAVTVRPSDSSAKVGHAADRGRHAVTIGEPVASRSMCDVGLGLGTAGAGVPSDGEAALLRRLDPAHLRCELHIADPGWRDALAGAGTTATALSAPLEVALFVPSAVRNADLSAVVTALAGVQVVRVLVAIESAQTTTAEETTPGPVVARVREALGLGPEVPVAGGTDMYFCELNRTRPEVELMDGVFWSMNGQVHAFDDLSLVETPEAQGEQVRTARDFAGDTPLFVGPVTLRRRYNVNATVAEKTAAEGLPDSVDPRQLSLMGAAWTLASVANLAAAGATTATYFETTGWRGVIQGDTPPAMPDLFRAPAGAAFPLFHVLADAAELRGGEVLECTGVPSLKATALAVRVSGGAATVLLANLTTGEVTLDLAGVGTEGVVRRLNDETATEAMLAPERFRKGASAMPIANLVLAPYETVRIDTQQE